MSTALDRARQVQRNAAEGITVSVKLALIEDLIAEIERLEAAQKGALEDKQSQRAIGSVKDIVMKHSGINHP